MRVYVGCFGSGLGHATRALEIAELLRLEGATVRFSSSGEVAAFIAGRGYACNTLPLADVRYSETGALSMRATMAASPTILARTCRQVSLEVANMKAYAPDVVLSDSALSTVLAAKLLGIRVYTMLNQLALSAPGGRAGAASVLLSGGTSAAMVKLWEMSDGILLPDLPPPYTISESNLWNAGAKNTKYVGFLASSDSGSADEAISEFSSDSRPRVFWQVSGPAGTREPLVRKAYEVASALSDEYSFVIADGDPAGSRKPNRVRGGWSYGWCEISQMYFNACDVVVSRAGHGTVAQAITSSKPSLLVPIPRQTEQEGNAAKAARLGVAVSLPQEELNVESFRRAMGVLMSEPYRSRSAALGSVARSYDARRAIADVIERAA